VDPVRRRRRSYEHAHPHAGSVGAAVVAGDVGRPFVACSDRDRLTRAHVRQHTIGNDVSGAQHAVVAGSDSDRTSRGGAVLRGG
jgi:hypothetical protein